jgi:flagellin
MNASVRSFKMAERNLEDAISLVNTAEGALNTLSAQLIRMRELLIQSANGINSAAERKMLDTEVKQLKREFRRICETTEFEGVRLLDGKGPNIQIAVGATSDSSSFIEINKEEIKAGIEQLGLSNVSAATIKDAQESLEAIDFAQNELSTTRSNIGAITQRLDSISDTQKTARTLIQTAKGRIADTDIAEEVADVIKGKILKESGISMLTQINKNPGGAMELLKT